MAVPVYDSTAWREFRGVPSSLGINSTTHLAKVADPTGKLHDCVVKLLPIDRPSLLCEAVGWVLARAAGIPCPAFAGIVMVPVEELRNHVSLPPEIASKSTCPAWYSELVPGDSLRQLHSWGYIIKLKSCLRNKDVRRIAAFDCWSDLRDRNLGNVIRTGSGGYVAIDHETILHDLLWLRAGIKYESRSLLAEAEKRLSQAELKKFLVEMAQASEAHLAAISSVATDIESIFNMIYPGLSPTLVPEVIEFLEARAQKGWMADKIRVIA